MGAAGSRENQLTLTRKVSPSPGHGNRPVTRPHSHKCRACGARTGRGRPRHRAAELVDLRAGPGEAGRLDVAGGAGITRWIRQGVVVEHELADLFDGRQRDDVRRQRWGRDRPADLSQADARGQEDGQGQRIRGRAQCRRRWPEPPSSRLTPRPLPACSCGRVASGEDRLGQGRVPGPAIESQEAGEPPLTMAGVPLLACLAACPPSSCRIHVLPPSCVKPWTLPGEGRSPNVTMVIPGRERARGDEAKGAERGPHAAIRRTNQGRGGQPEAGLPIVGIWSERLQVRWPAWDAPGVAPGEGASRPGRSPGRPACFVDRWASDDEGTVTAGTISRRGGG